MKNQNSKVTNETLGCIHSFLPCPRLCVHSLHNTLPSCTVPRCFFRFLCSQHVFLYNSHEIALDFLHHGQFFGDSEGYNMLEIHHYTFNNVFSLVLCCVQIACLGGQLKKTGQLSYLS